MRIEPSFTAASFSCPHCNAMAAQSWFDGWAKRTIEPKLSAYPAVSLGDVTQNEPSKANQRAYSLNFSQCYSCRGVAIWWHGRLVFPLPEKVDVEPNPHMPEEIRFDFLEAARIVNDSPRGAAALLRLALQKLINGRLGKEVDINAGIQELVDQGLPKRIQQACDVVRVVGNEAVHPGTIDLRDDKAMALKLFKFINLVVEHTVGLDAEMEEIYPSLPASKLEGIENRQKAADKRQATSSGD